LTAPYSGLAFQSEAEAFLAAHPDTAYAEAIFADMNGIVRGKQIPVKALTKLGDKGVNYPLSTLVLDCQGRMIADALKDGLDGDPDRTFYPVAGSLQPVPWAERPSAQVLMAAKEPDGSAVFCDPRAVLQRALASLQSTGLTPVVALELEFFLLDPTVQPPTPVKPLDGFPRMTGPQCLSADGLADFSGFIRELEDVTKAQGIPMTSVLCEYGDGQFEANLNHTSDAVKACDDAVCLKRAVRAVARKRGLIASFMAKPLADQTGSGLHIHMSLLNSDGRNIFAGDAKRTRMRHAIGGVLKAMPESIALLAPGANSFRRFQPGAFAPVSPLWGVNHRSVSLRIPVSGEADTRFEHRVAGADACPYLAAAVLFASAHYGLETKCDPGPMVEEGATATQAKPFPNRWQAALDALETGSILRPYLGEQFLDIYLAVKRDEEARYNAEVSDRDYAWYLRML
jgi:glutamine synthetase